MERWNIVQIACNSTTRSQANLSVTGSRLARARARETEGAPGGVSAVFCVHVGDVGVKLAVTGQKTA